MLPIVVVAAVLAFLFAKAGGAAAGSSQALPPPDPIPATAGSALLSPAMGASSPMYQAGNQLRLQANMANVQQPGNTIAWRLQHPAPVLPTAANGFPTPSDELPTVQQAQPASSGYHFIRKV